MKTKRSKFDATKLTLDELREANSEYLRRVGTKPRNTKPCMQCGHELGARERRKPCAKCGARNWDNNVERVKTVGEVVEQVMDKHTCGPKQMKEAKKLYVFSDSGVCKFGPETRERCERYILDSQPNPLGGAFARGWFIETLAVGKRRAAEREATRKANRDAYFVGGRPAVKVVR